MPMRCSPSPRTRNSGRSIPTATAGSVRCSIRSSATPSLPAGALAIVDNATGTVIGTTRLHFTPENFVEIGWTFVARSLWGGPTNRDVKTLLLDYIFAVEDVVMFRIGADNARSRRAVEKLGAEFDHHFETPRGQSVQYRLSSKSWSANKTGAR